MAKFTIGIPIPGKPKENKRQPVSRSQQNIVLDRQNGRCAECGDKLKAVSTKFHHRKPVCEGGKSTTSNLVALCSGCHDRIHAKERAKIADKKKAGEKKDVIEKEKKNDSVPTFINPFTGKEERIF